MINSQEGTSICDIKYKLVFLGDMSVGKTSIIERCTKGYFDENGQHTIGIDFLAKNIIYKQRMYRLQLWDTAGQQKFRSLIPTYLRDANLAVLVYDVSNPISFEHISQWLNLFQQYKLDEAQVFLVANKMDLKDRKVGPEGKSYAKQHGMHYFEVSAKKGERIEEMVESIIQILNNKKQESTKVSSQKTGIESNTERFQVKEGKKVKVVKFKKSKFSCCQI